MTERNAWLDTLRASAIIAVVSCHASAGFSTQTGTPRTGFLAALGLGGHGVDLFFVLSGWLLGGVLFRELELRRTIDLKRFWWRRWWRTLPAYYAVLGFSLFQRMVQGTYEVSDGWYAVFGQTYAFKDLPFFGVSWSLCVEEHFYLLIAPLLLLMGQRRVWVLASLALLIAIPIGVRRIDPSVNTFQTHARIDQCAIGVFLAYLAIAFPRWFQFLKSWSLSTIPVIVGLALVLFYARSQAREGTLPLEVMGIVSGLLVVLSQAGDFWRTSATTPALRYIAIRSYSLYLVHVEAIAVLKRFDVPFFALYFLLTWVLSLLFAELLYRLVEAPGMRIRDAAR